MNVRFEHALYLIRELLFASITGSIVGQIPPGNGTYADRDLNSWRSFRGAICESALTYQHRDFTYSARGNAEI
jgi:hypothetical protein